MQDVYKENVSSVLRSIIMIILNLEKIHKTNQNIKIIPLPKETHKTNTAVKIT